MKIGLRNPFIKAFFKNRPHSGPNHQFQTQLKSQIIIIFLIIFEGEIFDRKTKVWSKEVKPLEILKFRYFWAGHIPIFGPYSTSNNLSISIKKYFSTLWLKLLSNFTKREDWPSFCGLLRIFELCYFCSVIEQIFQNVFYSGLVDHKKNIVFPLFIWTIVF